MWKSEKVFEPEGGKLDGLKDVVSSALSNTMEDYNGLEAIPDLEDDLTEPSKSTSKVKKTLQFHQMKIIRGAVNIFNVLVTFNDFHDSDDEDEQGKNKKMLNTKPKRKCKEFTTCP